MTGLEDVLSASEVRLAIERDGLAWKLEDGCLVKVSKFADFASAVEFFNKVAEVAENENHHPDIEVSWSKVTLRLVTHSKGGITQKDVVVAALIDRLER
ncbi:MAG: 4a-hydroxytetrahydrobiopterin dehydratase [Actinobacteria bacterium]|nr:4a-hydroxytetrahydrobiopterin dehydratase [Actinomycetota bacterium]MCL5444968.1 4a-hydroxytetrahydrobiopterin dehydratase [Actinomycetota bacterium]